MKKKTSYAPYYMTIPLIAYYIYSKRHYLLGKRYRSSLINKAFLSRFTNDKYAVLPENKKNTTCLLGTIYPGNVYDFQKMFSYANLYKIPIINDINYSQAIIPYHHIKMNMSKFNNIVDFSGMKKYIKVQSGIKVRDLLQYLRNKNYTINELEQYMYSDLSLSDCLFNNYYGWNLQNCIEDFYVVTPKDEKIFSFRKFCDFTKNHFNFSEVFLRSSHLLGIVLDVKLRINRLKKYSYFQIKAIPKEVKIKDLLDKYKRSKDISEVIIVSSGVDNTYNIFLKVKEKGILSVTTFFYDKGIKFEKINQEQYYNEINFSQFSPITLRQIKILLNDNTKKDTLLKKIKFLLENNPDINPKIQMSIKTKLIEIIFPRDEDIKVIEKEFNLMKELFKIVTKLNGNFYLNNNIILNTKYDLMREIGYNNYFFEEDLKSKFDPNYILNPHLCFKKPQFFEFLKRKNRIWNYIFTKAKI